MDRHRYVAWVFVGATVVLLSAPWLLPQETWAALLGPGFNYQKGAVLVAFAGMAAAYVYYIVQFISWVRTRRSTRRITRAAEKLHIASSK